MAAGKTVAIIGTGWVGTSVAISTLHAGAADALWLHDMRADVAEGEAMDLAHGAAFYPACEVRTASIEEMRAAQVVVIAAGRNGKPGESRLALLRDNANLVADIGRTLAGFDGIIVVVSNPVDVLVRVMAAASGLPLNRVLGTGTMLDTARLRQMLGQELAVDTHSIHAQVLGEHGDSELVAWSGARVGGVPLRDWVGWTAEREQRLANEVKRAAYEVIQRKGATNHAIGLVTASLLHCLLRGERRVLTVSRVQDGAFGLHGVALSLPTLMSAQGGVEVLEPGLDAAERAALAASAGVLEQAFDSLSSP